MESIYTTNSDPRVLIAASIYPPDPGGPAMHAQKQFEWLKEKGINVQVRALTHYKKWPKGIRHLLFLFSLLLRAYNSDLIYAHDAWGVGFPALLAARLTRSKLVLRIGGDLAWEREVESNRSFSSLVEWYESGLYKNKYFYTLTKFVLSKADLVITPTNLISDIYKKYYGISQDKVHVIPNPIPGKKEVNAKEEPFVIYASRLVGYKNLNFSIKVFAKVLKYYPELKFIIMGEGPERNNLEDLVKRLNISKNVIFTGSVIQDIVMEYTSKCKFALAPALTEFNPNYILQCISFNKPFIISRENGFVFPIPEELKFNPKDEKELESKMIDLLYIDHYVKAQKYVTDVQATTWEDNLRNNFEVINMLLKSQK